MLATDVETARQIDGADSAPRDGLAQRLPTVLAFAASFALVVAYALPGGAYDLVIRREFGIVIWWILGAGVALGLLPRANPAPSVVLCLGALLAYLIWTALSLGWSESSGRTTDEVTRMLDYLGLFALVGCLLDRSTWRAAAMGLGAGALTVCLLATSCRLVPGAFPTDPFHRAHATNRLDYPFGYWNAVGAWCAMTAAIGLAWASHDRSKLRRAMVLGLMPIAVLAMYLTYSRAAVAGVTFGTVVVLAASRNRLTALLHTIAVAAAGAVVIVAARGAPDIANGTGTRGIGEVVAAIVLAVAIAGGTAILTSVVGLDSARIRRKTARKLGLAGVTALAFAAAVFGPSLGRTMWRQFRAGPAVTASADPAVRLGQLGGARYGYWSVALNAFKARPLFGSGAGTYEFLWNRDQRGLDFVRNAHSLEFENLAELGIPGLLLVVTVLAAELGTLSLVCRRTRRSVSSGLSVAMLGAFAVYLVQASVDWLWQSTAVTVLGLTAAAIAGARLSAARPAFGWVSRTTILVFSTVAVIVQIPGLLSTQELRRSQTAERVGNTALALSWANSSIHIEPWSASAYEQRGLVQEAAGRINEAARDLGHAVKLERTNFRHWLILARIETERGRFAAGIRDYKQAKRLRTRGLVFAYGPLFR